MCSSFVLASFLSVLSSFAVDLQCEEVGALVTVTLVTLAPISLSKCSYGVTLHHAVGKILIRLTLCGQYMTRRGRQSPDLVVGGRIFAQAR